VHAKPHSGGGAASPMSAHDLSMRPGKQTRIDSLIVPEVGEVLRGSGVVAVKPGRKLQIPQAVQARLKSDSVKGRNTNNAVIAACC
jgi:hypothetical protein